MVYWWLWKMIGIESTQKGVIAQLYEEGFKEGFEEGIKKGMKIIIDYLLSNNSVDEIALLLGWSVDEVNEVLKA